MAGQSPGGTRDGRERVLPLVADVSWSCRGHPEGHLEGLWGSGPCTPFCLSVRRRQDTQLLPSLEQRPCAPHRGTRTHMDPALGLSGPAVPVSDQ